jgi:hypothetical protein
MRRLCLVCYQRRYCKLRLYTVYFVSCTICQANAPLGNIRESQLRLRHLNNHRCYCRMKKEVLTAPESRYYIRDMECFTEPAIWREGTEWGMDGDKVPQVDKSRTDVCQLQRRVQRGMMLGFCPGRSIQRITNWQSYPPALWAKNVHFLCFLILQGDCEESIQAVFSMNTMPFCVVGHVASCYEDWFLFADTGLFPKTRLDPPSRRRAPVSRTHVA